MKKAISSIRHIHNLTKSFLFFWGSNQKSVFIVILLDLLYQCTRWMYCYYLDKKNSPYNCCNLCSWEIGQISREPIQTLFYYCHYWTRRSTDIETVRYKWPFLFSHWCPLLTPITCFQTHEWPKAKTYNIFKAHESHRQYIHCYSWYRCASKDTLCLIRQWQQRKF